MGDHIRRKQIVESKKDKSIRIATRLVESNVLAVEFAERLTRCKHEFYLGLNVYVEDLNEFSTYFVIDGHYESLMTSDTAENAAIALSTAKYWVRIYHSCDDEND